MTGYEASFDSIVGPTHNYSGLSFGNIASLSSKNLVSNPKEAALQGLKKMKLLHDLGLIQGVFPPHERPFLPFLRSIGFSGADKEIIIKAAKEIPEIFTASCSSASMWAANAATVSPSADSSDGKVHITPANLSSKLHRSIEHTATSLILWKTFPDPELFVHHSILPQGNFFSDEGAANHMRFCSEFDKKGVEVFVFGRSCFKSLAAPSKFPARQTLEASQGIARLHQLSSSHVVFAQSNPKAIDSGAFHNDVISSGHKHFFLYHEEAFAETNRVVNEIQAKFNHLSAKELVLAKVTNEQLPLKEACMSYLFNSQIVSLKNGGFALIAPTECEQMPRPKAVIDQMIFDKNCPIQSVYFLDLRQSMQNGGGPACLRLRVALTEKELKAVNPHVLLTDALYARLVAWVEKHYRDRLTPEELQDPKLFDESKEALDELSGILKLGSIYDFQK